LQLGNGPWAKHTWTILQSVLVEEQNNDNTAITAHHPELPASNSE